MSHSSRVNREDITKNVSFDLKCVKRVTSGSCRRGGGGNDNHLENRLANGTTTTLIISTFSGSLIVKISVSINALENYKCQIHSPHHLDSILSMSITRITTTVIYLRSSLDDSNPLHTVTLILYII